MKKSTRILLCTGWGCSFLGLVPSLFQTLLLLIEEIGDRSKAAAAGYADALPNAVLAFGMVLLAVIAVTVLTVLCLTVTKRRVPALLLIAVSVLGCVGAVASAVSIQLPAFVVFTHLSLVSVTVEQVMAFVRQGGVFWLGGLILLMIAGIRCLKEEKVML